MKLTVENFDLFTSDRYETLSLYRQNMDGGIKKLTFEDIDTLRNDRYSDALTVMGLHQDTFEYFIDKYASRFKAIRFYHNRGVFDWSALGKLKNLEFLDMFSNHGMTSLWDMSENYSLKALSKSNSSKLHSIAGIEKAPALMRFELGEVVYRTTVIDSFAPLAGTNIEYLNFTGKKVENISLTFLRDMPKLTHFDFPTNLFTTEEVAWIVANFPNLEGYALCAKIEIGSEINENDSHSTLIVGKRKPILDTKGNEAKIVRYVDQFNKLVEHYKNTNNP